MRKSIAENLIKWLNVAVALVIAMVMVLCTDAKVSARDLGSNLVIKDTQALLSDINVNSTSTTSARQLIASGANVDVVEVGAVPSTIYYNNTNSWSQPYAYMWSDSGNNKKWPGEKMENVENNIWKISVDSTYNMVIFSDNGNSNNQTGNLKIPTDGRNYYNNGEWTTYTSSGGSGGETSDISEEDLKAILKGEKIMVYAGERDDWGDNDKYYFTTDNTLNNPAATVDATNKKTLKDNVKYQYGFAILYPNTVYYQGHWTSGLKCNVEAGATYIVCGSNSNSAFSQKAVVNNKDYLYSYDAGSTRTADTVVDSSIIAGSQLSVTTNTTPGISSIGDENYFKYYLCSGANFDTIKEVQIVDGKVDTSDLPVGDYQLKTVLYDKSIYVLADTDGFSVVNPALAESVDLTSNLESVEKNTPLKLTATLTNKKTDATSVTYTFTNVSDSSLGGSFTSDTYEVTSGEDSASVEFTPTGVGTYIFKVVASCNGYTSVEDTVTVTVEDEAKYYLCGRINGHLWSYDSTDMPFTKVKEGLYKYETGKSVAELSYIVQESNYSRDQFFFIHTGSGKDGVWYASKVENEVSIGHTFYKYSSSENPLTLTEYNGDDTTESNLLRFVRSEDADDYAGRKNVTLYLDTSGTDKKLYYTYESSIFNITYTNDGNGEVTGPVTGEADESIARSEFTVTPKQGYELDTLTFDDVDITSSDSVKMPSKDVVVHATFKPKTYNITYKLFTGSNEEDTSSLTPKTYTFSETKSVALPVPEKTGYTFGGWKKGSTSGALATEISSGEYGDKKYYGSFTAKKYTVTFDPDGGSFDEGVSDTKQVTFNSAFGTLPTPQKPGASFKGWYYTDDEGNKTEITATSTLTVASDITLVAEYNDNPTVKVKLNYGETVTEKTFTSQSIATDNTVTTDQGEFSVVGDLQYNSDVTVTATPKSGYYIYNVTGTGISAYNIKGDPWTKTYDNVKANITIEVTIVDVPKLDIEVHYNSEKDDTKATVTYDGKTLTADADKIFNINPEKYGESKNIVVQPADGYYISSVTDESTTLSSAKSGIWQYSFDGTGSKDKKIVVNIADNPKVKLSCVEFATGDPLDEPLITPTINGATATDEGIKVSYGSTVTLTVKIDSSIENQYEFRGFYKKGDDTPLDSSYALSYYLTNVTEDAEIVAKFDKLYAITVNWENLDGLKIDGVAQAVADETVTIYRFQGATIEITTTINESSEYKLNAGCFVPENIVGSYSNNDNVTTKKYNCTVGSNDATVTITPKPATYSGTGYWGDKLMDIYIKNSTAGGQPYNQEAKLAAKFDNYDKYSALVFVELVKDSSNVEYRHYVIPVRSGSTSITITRYAKGVTDFTNPGTANGPWNTQLITFGDNTSYILTGCNSNGMSYETGKPE